MWWGSTLCLMSRGRAQVGPRSDTFDVTYPVLPDRQTLVKTLPSLNFICGRKQRNGDSRSRRYFGSGRSSVDTKVMQHSLVIK